MEDSSKKIRRGWKEWFAIVAGWLACAALCLGLTISLEAYPAGYDTFYPLAILILFGNVFLFMFIGSRWAGQPVMLYASVARLCVGEALLLGGFYLLGRFAM